MTFFDNLRQLYVLVPFIFLIKNKVGFFISLFYKSNFKIKIHNQLFYIPKSRFETLLYLLNCLVYAITYSIDSDKILKISFDENNSFEIPLEDFSFENTNLLELLCLGNKFGANFITNDDFDHEIRNKTIIISSQNNRKIITISNGISFFLDSMHPGNTIDVGSECGDTPLFFAELGAKVFAFEALKKHYNFMLNNLTLNSKLSEKIIPINAAIGKDGPLNFFLDSENDERGTLGASFIYNNQKNDFKYETVTGYKLSTARKKFQINHIDLLKMDCKGCEFFLTSEDLKNIDRIKIEYSIHDKNHKLENLLKLLKENNFHCMLFRNSSTTRRPTTLSGNIFASRI
jgi:FkbM family methyltransferase